MWLGGRVEWNDDGEDRGRHDDHGVWGAGERDAPAAASNPTHVLLMLCMYAAKSNVELTESNTVFSTSNGVKSTPNVELPQPNAEFTMTNLELYRDFR